MRTRAVCRESFERHHPRLHQPHAEIGFDTKLETRHRPGETRSHPVECIHVSAVRSEDKGAFESMPRERAEQVAQNRFEGFALRTSQAIKSVLYTVLLFAAVYWGFNGDFVDFWDAFLWLVAFVFIELNVFEWRQEVNESTAHSEITATS